MSRVEFRPEAEADLLAIALFVAEDSPQRALRVIGQLRARCEILKRHPEAGPARPELGDNMRSLNERPYVIVYRLTHAGAEVVAFLHGARDLPKALANRIGKSTK